MVSSTVDPELHVKYRVIAVGGTFDVLHRGHRELLRLAFALGRRVLIGVTSQVFVKRLHKPHRVDSYEARKRYLERLLRRWGVLSRARIVPLQDRYGPTITDPRIEALVVSRRTITTAQAINSFRKSKRLKPLAIISIELVLADDNRPISSTRIRRGTIDRRGKLLRSTAKTRLSSYA